jgi:hypothetical protein
MPNMNEKDRRSDIEQMVESRSDDADAAKGGVPDSPLKPSGVGDGVGGTAGVVKNQDDMAQ